MTIEVQSSLGGGGGGVGRVGGGGGAGSPPHNVFWIWIGVQLNVCKKSKK